LKNNTINQQMQSIDHTCETGIGCFRTELMLIVNVEKSCAKEMNE
jgi:hypothetical protein